MSYIMPIDVRIYGSANAAIIHKVIYFISSLIFSILEATVLGREYDLCFLVFEIWLTPLSTSP